MPDIAGRSPEAAPIIPSVEQAPRPEASSVIPAAERAVAEAATLITPVQPVAPSVSPLQKIETPALRQNVERILSEGLEETFKTLDPEHQQQFKAVGEETAAKIEVMLQSAKFKVGKMIDLIIGWLKIIPGVNKYFLEQEAKNKADKLLRLRAGQ